MATTKNYEPFTFTSYMSLLEYRDIEEKLAMYIAQAIDDADAAYFAGTDDEVMFYRSFAKKLESARKELELFIEAMEAQESVIIGNEVRFSAKLYPNLAQYRTKRTEDNDLPF